jgi:NAD(P)-dependent dehydrogenase (short-subunit alcohol dehydrogenase family)
MELFNIDTIPSQKGRLAIVTGANTGLGFETSLALAGKEIKVIMACRNEERAEKAKEEILRKVPSAELEIMIINLSSLSSVRDFAKRFLMKYDHLDLLINNAGIMVPPYSKTEDGFESQMGANYFGHFLLTGLLMDVIKKTEGSRIISLSSIAHKNGKINFKDLHWEKEYSAMGAYRQSKLACLIFATELQRRFEKSGVRTLSVAAHPGVSLTELVRHIPKWLYSPLKPLLSLFTHSPEKGALPTLYAALGAGVSGGDYFGPQGFAEMTGMPGKAIATSVSRDREIAKQLWDLSEKLTGITY